MSKIAVAIGASAFGGLFLFFGPLTPGAPWGAQLGAALLGLVIAAGPWRMALVGIRTGPRGIKVRTIYFTRVVPWADVEHIFAGRIDNVPAIPANPLLIFLLSRSRADFFAIFIGVRGRRPLETPVRRRTTMIDPFQVMLGPDAFARARQRLRDETDRWQAGEVETPPTTAREFR